MNDNIINRSRTLVNPGALNSLEEEEQKKAEKTIKNWLEIQKIVKVVQSLEEMMEEQHEDHINKLNNIIREFYELKIETREIYNDIKFLKLNAEGNNPDKRPYDYFIFEKNNAVLGMAERAISDFLFTIRENFDYIPIIVSLIGENLRERIESIAELFCNQFYDNILIPNPEQEELLICTYKLLEFEIEKMHSSNVEQFLNDSSFLGVFMSVFSKQNDLNNFLNDLLGKLMNILEDKAEECLDVSLYAIKRSFKREEKRKKGQEKERESVRKTNTDVKKETEEEKEQKKNERKKLFEKMFKNIMPKEKINFRKKLEFEEENMKLNSNNEIRNIDSEDDSEDEGIVIGSDRHINDIINKNKDEIQEEITFDFLAKKIKTIKNKDLKSYYIHILNQIEDDPNIYTKEKFIDILSEDLYAEDGMKTINKFKDNVFFVLDQVQNLIQNLASKSEIIPYTVRCICKIIDILIAKKFPKLPKYLRHSFIGKFLFNKCIFPVISLENKKTLKKIMFSNAQKRCLLNIIDIISAANECHLFNYYDDVEKSLFNNYLLGLTPILNKFYDKLINLRLPKQLNEIISNSPENMEKKSFLFGGKKNPAKNINYKPTTYDYFAQNPDELLRIESVCFSIDDLMFIKDLIDENREKFKHLPHFEKAKGEGKVIALDMIINEINSYEYKFANVRKSYEKEGRKPFFVLNKLTISPKVKEFLSRKKLEKNDSTLARIKNRIKTILRGLNLLDIKDYSYLYKATSNEKFFQAINHSLKETEEEEDGIPLKWYTQYIMSNIPKIEDQSYIKDDLKKLYEEMLSEQSLLLKERNKLSPEINAREGMNLQCAKKIADKIRYDEKILDQTKKYQKLETFIVKEHTQICIRVNDNISESKKPKERLDNLKSLVMKQERENTEYVQVINANNCEHRSESFMGKMEGKSDLSIKTHAKKVNQFISKFSDPKNPVIQLRKLLEYINEDIELGEPKHRIFVAFEEYKNILQKDILSHEKELIESTDPNEQKKELEEILNRIDDHIMLKLYRYVFPKNPSEHLKNLDFQFYKKTFLYEWIPPNILDIKMQLGLDEIEGAKSSLKQMEDEAQSIYEKLNCVKDVFENVSKAFQFNTGKKEALSADDHIPILSYIVIQTHPKRYVSNVHYISCFFNPERTDQNYGVFLKNLNVVYENIQNLSAEILKYDENEFKKNVEEAEKNFEKKQNEEKKKLNIS